MVVLIVCTVFRSRTRNVFLQYYRRLVSRLHCQSKCLYDGIGKQDTPEIVCYLPTRV